MTLELMAVAAFRVPSFRVAHLPRTTTFRGRKAVSPSDVRDCRAPRMVSLTALVVSIRLTGSSSSTRKGISICWLE